MACRKWCGLPLNQLYNKDLVKVQPILKGRVKSGMCGCIASKSWTMWNQVHFQNLYPIDQSISSTYAHWSSFSSQQPSPPVHLFSQKKFKKKKQAKSNGQQDTSLPLTWQCKQWKYWLPFFSLEGHPI